MLQKELDVSFSSLPPAIEFIGSKRQLLDFVINGIEYSVDEEIRTITDLFSGTGVVSSAFKSRGYSVFANDHLAICYNMTASSLLNSKAPDFNGLPSDLIRTKASPYLSVIHHLNVTEPIRGFVYNNFSPAAIDVFGVDRRYFTESNAAKIDAIREKIHEWEPYLAPMEKSLLLTDLIRAVSLVSNVAGTYGCYLKKWKARALNSLQLKPSSFVVGDDKSHKVTRLDAEEAVKVNQSPIVYADPPYTKRQYAAYYHVLETIVRNDKPELFGNTGLRNWEEQSSDFCYKRKAEGALERLIRTSSCDHFFLSYNEDGQISHDRILNLLSSYGTTNYFEMKLRRYRSSSLTHKGPTVSERLYHLRRV
ncbi:DNA adenine methylase [Halomonas sp. Bachu 37]|uniref:DNA adenine methylase n=1 Tax=Halomonas kashgarensis TaxID=3084920 RepID=UPI003217FEA1